MKVKYHTRDFTPGFRDGAYFSVKNEASDEICYWLTDKDGNRAPEGVYQELESSNQLQDCKGWNSSDSTPKKYENILFYCDELDGLCAGFCDDNEGILVSLGLEEYKPDEAPLYISKDLVSKWRYM